MALTAVALIKLSIREFESRNVAMGSGFCVMATNYEATVLIAEEHTGTVP
jgi:hypothetical protein